MTLYLSPPSGTLRFRLTYLLEVCCQRLCSLQISPEDGPFHSTFLWEMTLFEACVDLPLGTLCRKVVLSADNPRSWSLPFHLLLWSESVEDCVNRHFGGLCSRTVIPADMPRSWSFAFSLPCEVKMLRLMLIYLLKLCCWRWCVVCRQAQLDQEHRDRELALRLAMEDQNAVEDISLPPPLPR